MCSTSVEPNPSTISRLVRVFQPLKTSADSTSAADSAMRSEEKSVGEKNFWYREADVVDFKLQHMARERGLAVGHIVLQMDNALGTSGRARRIHPERHLVTVGVGFGEIGRKSRQPTLSDDRI